MDKRELEKMISEVVTPSYIFDVDILEKRVMSIKDTLSKNVNICYAMKANPFLIGSLDNIIDKFEVCSPGEFRICKRNRIDMKKVVLSGVYKNPDDMKRIVNDYAEKITYTVESYNQFLLLVDCADMIQKKIPILLRISSGNQFGIDKKTLEQIISDRKKYKFIEIKGIQLYSGTQKKSIKQIQKELLTLDEYCFYLKGKFDFSVEEIEYGPGLYVSYFSNEDEKDDEMLSEFSKALRNIQFDGKITLEMGRFIASSCGTYLTSIVDLKETDGKKYCIVDGGINHVNYYGQTMAMRTPLIEQIPMRTGNMDKWNICGSLCTVGDLLVKQLLISNARVGDVLAFKKIGAYSVTEGIYLFLSRDMPGIYLYSVKKGLELVRHGLPTDVLNSVNGDIENTLSSDFREGKK